MSLKSPLSKCSNVILLVLITLTATNNHSVSAPKELPGTAPLSWNGDIASRLIDNCDQFLLKQIEQAVKKRNSSLEIPDREKLKTIIGIRDKRIQKPMLYLSDIDNNYSAMATGSSRAGKDYLKNIGIFIKIISIFYN